MITVAVRLKVDNALTIRPEVDDVLSDKWLIMHSQSNHRLIICLQSDQRSNDALTVRPKVDNICNRTKG